MTRELADLTDPRRLDQLFHQAVATGAATDTPSERLRWFAAAQRALTLSTQNPCGFFMRLFRQNLWHHITNAQEDAARVKLRQLDNEQGFDGLSQNELQITMHRKRRRCGSVIAGDRRLVLTLLDSEEMKVGRGEAMYGDHSLQPLIAVRTAYHAELHQHHLASQAMLAEDLIQGCLAFGLPGLLTASSEQASRYDHECRNADTRTKQGVCQVEFHSIPPGRVPARDRHELLKLVDDIVSYHLISMQSPQQHALKSHAWPQWVK